MSRELTRGILPQGVHFRGGEYRFAEQVAVIFENTES